MTEPMTDEQLTKLKTMLDRHTNAVPLDMMAAVHVLFDDATCCHTRIRDLEAEESRNHDRIAVMIVELERWRERVRELVKLHQPDGVTLL